MSEMQNNNDLNNFDDEIDLLELFNVLWQGKWIIISITCFVSIIAVCISLLLPNIYESKALLTPADSSGSISRSIQSYSGIAGLAGISLPSGGDESNTAKAIQKLRTLSFFENNILPNIFLPDLMAHKTWDKSWDPSTNTLNYNESIYNKKTETWIRDYSYPYKQIPSAQESFREFTTHYLNLSEDKKTGFITLTIKHKSPYIARQWSELLVNQVNLYYREKDKFESEKAVSFLNKQIAMTNLSEVKEAIAQLLQEETKKLTLIEANELYVFDYIDPPAVMEKKSEPGRAFIVIFSALLGGMLSVLLVLIRHYFFSHQSPHLS